MKSIGIDIGSYSVKIAELESGSDFDVLTSYSEYQLNQDPTHDKEIEILDILRNQVDLHSEGTFRIVVAASQRQVSHQTFDFPFRERHKILKSLPSELEDWIPFFADQAIIDAKVISYRGDGARVLASAIPRPHLLQLLKECQNSELDPDIVSVPGLALANLLEDWQATPPEYPEGEVPTPEQLESSVVIHIGHETTFIMVYRQAELINIRTINWGGKDVAQAIARAYSLPYVEALSEMKKKAFVLIDPAGATEDQLMFSNVIKESIDQLAQRLRLMLLGTQNADNIQFTRAYLSGGPSRIANLGAHLTQRLELATNNLQCKNHHLNIADSNFDPATGGIALGLAVEGLKKARNPAINLLKGEFAKKNQTTELLIQKWKYSAKMAAVAVLLLFVYAGIRDEVATTNTDEARTILKSQAKAIANLKGRKASSTNVRKYIAKQKKKEKSGKVLQELQGVTSALDVLKKVSDNLPSNKLVKIDVRRLSIQDSVVKIEGLVNPNQKLDIIEKALSNVSSNKKVTKLKPSIPARKGKVPFAFQLNVRRKSRKF